MANKREGPERLRVADGPPQRIRDKGQQHPPGDEAWLVSEYRTSAPITHGESRGNTKPHLRPIGVQPSRGDRITLEVNLSSQKASSPRSRALFELQIDITPNHPG
jgi:hypothetical protein